MSGLLFLFMFLVTSKGHQCSGTLCSLSMGSTLNLPQRDNYLWIPELISPKTSIRQSEGNSTTTGLASSVIGHQIRSCRKQERQGISINA